MVFCFVRLWYKYNWAKYMLNSVRRSEQLRFIQKLPSILPVNSLQGPQRLQERSRCRTGQPPPPQLQLCVRKCKHTEGTQTWEERKRPQKWRGFHQREKQKGGIGIVSEELIKAHGVLFFNRHVTLGGGGENCLQLRSCFASTVTNLEMPVWNHISFFFWPRRVLSIPFHPCVEGKLQ